MADRPQGPGGRVGRRECALALQAALLDMDQCVRGMADHSSDEAVRAGARAVADAIGTVWMAYQELLEHGPGGLAAVPAWLGPRRQTASGDASAGHPAGVGLLQDRVDHPADAWEKISELLASDPADWLLTRLAESWLDRDQSAGPGEPDPVPDRSDGGGADHQQVEVLFPVIHKATGQGFLAELVIQAGGPGEAQFTVTRSRQLTPKFRSGLHAGYQAGLALVRELGAPEQACKRWETYDIIDVRGVPSDYTIDDSSAGLSMAVAIVRRILGVPVPAMLVSGAIREDGVVTDLPSAEEFTHKARGAHDHGLGLLAARSGVQLSLVCAQLWPEEWPQVLRRVARSALADLDHQVSLVTNVGTNTTAMGVEFRLVRTFVVRKILKRLDAGASAVVVGGSRSSSRTTSVRQAALEWRDRTGVPVIELRLNAGLLPDFAELRRILLLARNAVQVGADEEAVVILEDLLPYEDAMDLDAVLPGTARAARATIIAVCLYAGRPRWVTDQLATVPTFRRPADVHTFAAEFVELNGLGELDAGLIGRAERTAAGDLWWLVQLLMDLLPLPADAQANGALALAATATLLSAVDPAELAMGEASPSTPGPETGQSDALRRAYARQLQGRFAPDQLDRLRGVAAASLLHVTVPEVLLLRLPREMLHWVGAQRNYPGRWFIARSLTCRALLAEDGLPDASARKWKRTASSQFFALKTLLEPHLRRYDPTVMDFVTALLAAAHAIEPNLHFRLLTFLTPIITEQINEAAPPALVAHALEAGGEDYSHDDRHRLVGTLLKSILTTGWAAMPARAAVACLRAIRSHRDDVTGELLQAYHSVLGTVGRDVRGMLSRGDPEIGVFFVHELGRYYEEMTERQVVPLAICATTRCNPQRIEHYEAASRLLDAALKYASERTAPIIDTFVRAPGVRRLLEEEHRDDAGLILAQLALKIMLGLHDDPYGPSSQRIGLIVNGAFGRGHSTSASVARGLMLMEQADVRAARRVIAHCGIAAWIRTSVLDGHQQVVPWHAAQLIRALGKVDGLTCSEALYETDGSTPRASVIDALVKSVKGMGDLKGVGHVVSAVTSVDAFWGPGGSASASAELCDRLKYFVNAALSTETRGSVVLAVVTALVEASVPEDTLRALLERCVEVVQAEAEDNDRDYVPRLALLLAGNEAVGSQFLQMLGPRLDDDLLLSRMTGCQSVEARGSYLDLARALHRLHDPRFCERFVSDNWLKQSLTRLEKGNVVSALKALSFFSLALRDAGIPVDNERLLRLVHKEPKDWALRLRKLYSPAQLSEALHVLRNIAPGLAHECLRELNALYWPEGKFSGRLTIASVAAAGARDASGTPPAKPTPTWIAQLEQQKKAQREAEGRQLTGLVRLIERQFIDPSQAIELIHAVGAIDRDAGQSVGTVLSAGKTWGKRTLALLDIDSPVHLGSLLRMMARANLDLPADVLERLFRSWRSQAFRFRAPIVAYSMTCGLGASGPRGVEMAHEWAANVNIEQMGRRIGRGRPGDMEMAPSLVNALDEWGPAGSADEIAQAVPADAACYVSPAAAVDILRMVRTRNVDGSQEQAEAAATAIAAHAHIWYTRDPEEHWRDLGWLIRSTRALIDDGALDHDDIVAAVMAGCRRPEVVSWVRGCLGELPSDEDWYWADDPPTAWARAARLVVRSDLGATEATAADEVNDILGNIGLRWKLELLCCASRDAVLRAAFIGDNRTFIEELGQWYVQVGWPVGRQLIRAAEDLDLQPLPSGTA